MFAVSSVDAAKLYYEALNDLQKSSDKPLKIATIFSFAANEEQDAVGDILDRRQRIVGDIRLARTVGQALARTGQAGGIDRGPREVGGSRASPWCSAYRAQV